MRKRISLLLTFAILISMLSCFQITAHAIEPVISDRIYYLRNAYSNMYMDCSDNQPSSVVYQNIGYRNANQRFRIRYTGTYNGEPVYAIIPMINEGLRLDVNNRWDANATSVKAFTYNGDVAQMFAFIDNGNGTYRIRASYSASQCIEVIGASTTEGTPIQTWSYVGGANQQWILEPADGGSSGGNNTFATASGTTVSSTLNSSTTISTSLSSSSDVDYYKLTPPRHGVLEIQLSPQSNMDIDLYVYDANQTLVGQSTRGTGQTDAVQRVTVRGSDTSPTLETYYIKAIPYSSSYGSYSLNLAYRNIYSSYDWGYVLNSSVSSNRQINDPVGYRWLDGPEYHTGLDIASYSGAPIYSAGAGTVKEAGFEATMGNYVMVTSANDSSNKTVLRYMHMSSKTKNKGNSVANGEVIGYVGQTGQGITGPHLHVDANSAGYTSGPTIRANPRSIINLMDFWAPSINFTGTRY